MKKSRTLSIILTMALLLSFLSIPVSAATAEDALETLGIITGSGSGVTGEYLAGTATRTQAALVNLRLVGLEDDAFAFEDGETFTDAADATEFWQPVLEYLKANPMLGWVGYSDGSFKPNEPITGQGFTKVLLAALGYEYGLHFDWETTMNFAKSLEMTTLIDKAEQNLTLGDLADAVFEALGTKTDDDRDLTLISKLVADGVITKDTAVLAGFDIEEPTLSIVNAYPSAVDEITVLMNMDIPEDVSLTLKRGDIGIAFDTTVTSDTVLLSGLYRFLPGTYTVIVDDESASFVIESRTATDLVIEADTIYDSGEQDLNVKLADQYGDAMSLAGANISVFNQTTGYVFAADSADKTVKITIGEIGETTTMNAKADDVVYVFVFDPVSGLTATKEVLVVEAPCIAWLEIGDVTLGKLNDNTPSRLYVGTTGNKLDVTAYDQYNQVYTLTAADIGTGTANKIQLLSSNEGVINSAMSVDKGDLVFDAEAAGSAVITLIIPNQGFIATSQMITAYANPSLKAVEIAGPVEAVYAGETAKFEIAGYDQYGAPIDVVQDTGDVTFTATVDLDDTIGIGATNQVDFQALNNGSTTVYYFCKGVFQGTFTVVVNPEAYPMQIVGIENVPGALLTDAIAPLNYSNFTVVDQYGRTVDLKRTFREWRIMMWTEEGSDSIGVEEVLDYMTKLISNPNDFVLYTLEELDTDTVYAGLVEPSDIIDIRAFGVAPSPKAVETSIYAFDVKHVSENEIYEYDMTVLDQLLLSDTDEQNRYSQMRLYEEKYRYIGLLYPYPTVKIARLPFFNPYTSPLIITAYLEDGTEVALDSKTRDGIPSVIDLVTFSLEGVETGYGTRLELLDSPTVWSGYENEGSCTVKAWIKGETVASASFEVSSEAPVVTSITAEARFVDGRLQIFPDSSETLFGIVARMELTRDYIDSESMLFDDKSPDSFESDLFYLLGSLFKIQDQYGVELFWLDLLEEGKINYIVSTRDTQTGTDSYLTIMTADGMLSDTIRIADTDFDFLK